jgi:long-chain-fatty-acid--CoA ligase ACSBG
MLTIAGHYCTPWLSWTWNEYRANVDAFGKALIHLGCIKFDCINIIGFNAPEWFFANYGAIAAGCIASGIYTTNAPDACNYISGHSKAKVVVCEGVHQLQKYYEISKQLPDLKALIMYGGDALPDDVKSKCSVPCYTFQTFIAMGKGEGLDKVLQERSNSWQPGETCTLIYTSGTTGPPKVFLPLLRSVFNPFANARQTEPDHSSIFHPTGRDDNKR